MTKNLMVRGMLSSSRR